MYDINILPPKMRKKRKKKVKIGNPTYAPILLAIVLLGAFFMNSSLDKSINQVQTQREELISDVQTLQQQLDKVNQLTSQKQMLIQDIQRIEKVVGGDFRWYIVLDEISSVVPPDVLIKSIQRKEGNVIVMEAITHKLYPMVQTKESMTSHPSFKEVSIEKFTYPESSIIGHKVDNKVEFTIVAKYQDVDQQSLYEQELNGDETKNEDLYMEDGSGVADDTATQNNSQNNAGFENPNGTDANFDNGSGSFSTDGTQ